MTDLAKMLRENSDVAAKAGRGWTANLERKAAAELERLRRERDTFERLAAERGDALVEWQEVSGCSHASAVKRELERLRAEVERLKEANHA